MKLYHWQPKNGKTNFGDELNVWLWHKLLPDILDNDESTAFIGIGTLLNDVLVSKTPQAQRRIIFSSGVGYGKTNQFSLDDSCKVYCVRGPLSARRLELDEALGIVDGAVLTKKLIKSNLRKKKTRFSFMPHLTTMRREVKDVCQELGYDYILPTLPVENVFQRIAETEILLTEAMHGAIVADALRVPWIPIVTHRSINQFKWTDWCSSVGIEYQPEHVHINQYKANLGDDLLTPFRYFRNTVSSFISLRENKSNFQRLTSSKLPCLSDEIVQDHLIERLEEKLSNFRRDFREISLNA